MRRFGFTLPPARRAARSFTCICKRFFAMVFFATLLFFGTVLTALFSLGDLEVIEAPANCKAFPRAREYPSASR